jgi:putative nucleotidyltransferase with HDIG domain
VAKLRVDWAAVRFHASRWIWVPALAGLVAIAFPRSAGELSRLLEGGAVASQDVVAPFNFVVNKSDDELQREADELAASARPIYEFQTRAYDSATAALEGFFEVVGRAASRGAGAVVTAGKNSGVSLTAEEAAYLVRGARRENLERALTGLFERTLGQGVANTSALRADQAREFIIRRGATETAVARTQVLTFARYLTIAKSEHPDPGSSAGETVYLKLAGHFFRPTLTPNRVETDRRRDELRRSVDPSKYVVRAGDRLVAAHEIVTTETAERLRALHQEMLRRGSASSPTLAGVLGALLRDSLVLGLFWVLMVFYRRETYRDHRQVALVGILFAAVILGAAAVGRWFPEHPELIPLPLAAIVLTVLFNGRVSMIAMMILAVLIGSQAVFHDRPAMFLCIVGGVTAALSVRSLRRRSQLYIAVLVVSAGYLSGAVALGLVGGWRLTDIGASALFGGTNAFFSASLTLLALPLAESLTRITTDLTLLELSDPSRPLLRRLSLEAPGTYAHSIAMANLVEAACDRIGANGLLGRVGCYYHDCGKLGNPLYFVENQSLGGNPHDRLHPRKSAEIIRAHVTDGLRLAEEARLPGVVAAFIPEHHGTAEITYFLERARQKGDLATDDPEFRYPGPKPQSVETAIAMLADSVEAALRVLEDMTPRKIQEAIDHIVRNKVTAGQLNDTPITLQQIELAKAEFLRVLGGMYHNRIDYPESRGGISADWQAPSPARRSIGL